jgi:hypothetical protein
MCPVSTALAVGPRFTSTTESLHASAQPPRKADQIRDELNRLAPTLLQHYRNVGAPHPTIAELPNSSLRITPLRRGEKFDVLYKDARTGRGRCQQLGGSLPERRALKECADRYAALQAELRAAAPMAPPGYGEMRFSAGPCLPTPRDARAASLEHLPNELLLQVLDHVPRDEYPHDPSTHAGSLGHASRGLYNRLQAECNSMRKAARLIADARKVRELNPSERADALLAILKAAQASPAKDEVESIDGMLDALVVAQRLGSNDLQSKRKQLWLTRSALSKKDRESVAAAVINALDCLPPGSALTRCFSEAAALLASSRPGETSAEAVTGLCRALCRMPRGELMAGLRQILDIAEASGASDAARAAIIESHPLLLTLPQGSDSIRLLGRFAALAGRLDRTSRQGDPRAEINEWRALPHPLISLLRAPRFIGDLYSSQANLERTAAVAAICQAIYLIKCHTLEEFRTSAQVLFDLESTEVAGAATMLGGMLKKLPVQDQSKGLDFALNAIAGISSGSGRAAALIKLTYEIPRIRGGCLVGPLTQVTDLATGIGEAEGRAWVITHVAKAIRRCTSGPDRQAMYDCTVKLIEGLEDPGIRESTLAVLKEAVGKLPPHFHAPRHWHQRIAEIQESTRAPAVAGAEADRGRQQEAESAVSR